MPLLRSLIQLPLIWLRCPELLLLLTVAAVGQTSGSRRTCLHCRMLGKCFYSRLGCTRGRSNGSHLLLFPEEKSRLHLDVPFRTSVRIRRRRRLTNSLHFKSLANCLLVLPALIIHLHKGLECLGHDAGPATDERRVGETRDRSFTRLAAGLPVNH